MSDKLTQWKETLGEKLKYRTQLESALNKTTAEILQLQGGIQFAEESTEVSSEESSPENS
tara:strand:- start:622 stop:801 length:180 start_codon:yes stop_codon:yes gene_type:complete